MQTQTSNTLHNAIVEAGSKDCWKEKFILDAEGNPTTATQKVFETYKYVMQEIRDQLNAEAEAVQIILTGIDNDIYSTVDAYPNACEMWKAVERLKQGESINVQDLETNLFWEFGKFTSLDGESLESYYSRFYKMMNELTRNQCKVTNHQVNVQFLLQLQPEWQRNRGKVIVNSPQPIYDQEPSMVDDDDETSKEKEIDKLMALISLSFKKIYKPTNNNLRTSSNTSRANQDNSLRIHKNAGYESQRSGNVAGARVTVDAVDSGPIFDTEPEQKVHNDDHYDVFAIECQHSEQSKSVHKTYLTEQAVQNVLIESVDMSYDSEKIDQNDEDADLDKERELLASLTEKLKCEINESKNRNKYLETSNKVLVDKLKSEIEDFKNKNKSLELSYNQSKEANNKLSQENDLLYADYKKSKTELARCNTKEYASQMELECAKEDKELKKVIELENKVKVLDNIVYKTGQSVQTMNMLNNKCRTSFVKPEYLKKAKQANPRLRFKAGLDLYLKCLNEEIIVDLRYFNSLELELDSLTSQLETQKTQFVNEIDRISREYYYVDHMHAILGVYTELDEVTNLQCDNLELLQKFECLETELSKSKMMSKSFESVQKHAINFELKLQQCKEKIKDDMSFKVNKSKDFCKEREQYVEIQDLKT
nr:hypothetical protein [Tanacetum cinerariifolium]